MANTTNDRGPSYYKRGRTNVWDFIRDQGLNFHLGNAIKYIARAGHKGNATYITDLEKAIHYLQNELEHSSDVYLDPSPRVQKKLQHNGFPFASVTNSSEKFDR